MDIVEQLREIAKQDENYIPVGESINTLAADEIEQLRAFKAACEGQEAVAYLHEWSEDHPFGDTTVAEYCCNVYPSIQEGSFDTIKPLFEHPDPAAAQLRMRVKELEEKWLSEQRINLQIEAEFEELASQLAYRTNMGGKEPPDLEVIRQSPRQFVDMETVESLADYALCLELKVARQQDQLATRDQQVAEACAELAETCFEESAAAAEAIRSGEWRKYMKGGE